jgi:predicted ATP-dependent endonuclease of OLD family
MDAVRLKNLRNLEDTGFIQIKPITFLLGSNSSGKSTFLRSFPLIRQSVAARTTGPILWYGNLVDFGSFSEVLNNKSSTNEISFLYKFRIPKSSNEDSRLYWFRLYQALLMIEDIDVIIELKMTTEEERQSITICKEIVLSLLEHKIIIETNSNGEVIKFKVNDSDFLTQGLQLRTDQSGSFIPQVFKVKDERNDIDIPYYSYTKGRTSLFLETLVKKVKELVHHNASRETIASLVRSFGIGSSKTMLANIKATGKGGETWKKKVAKWSESSSDYKHLRDLIIANSLLSIFASCDDYISTFARNISYIGPVRATAERYYRSQDLAVGDVDSQGKNLAMFVRNLTNEEQADFAEWTEKNFGFSVHVRPSGEHVSLKIIESDLKNETNLADTGFGFSQVLPILTQLWWLGKRSARSGYRLYNPIVFAIEQPELHLHPKLQASLADSFISAIESARELGIDLRLIIETHSETLINRFGHQIANRNFDNDDVNVVLFNRKKPGDPVNIRIASYDDDGFLNNWPLGFFEPDMI